METKIKWLEGDRNSGFFHGMESASQRVNNHLLDGAIGMEDREEITTISRIANIYANNDWVRPSLDKLAFSSIGEEKALWLKRGFEEELRGIFFSWRKKLLIQMGFL